MLTFQHSADVSSAMQNTDNLEDITPHEVVSADVFKALHRPGADPGELRVSHLPWRARFRQRRTSVNALVYRENEPLGDVGNT